MNLRQLRNIGISAHIDSGKTTLSERILFYAGRIHRMGEVRGEGATLDYMELEKERGITITSAATSVDWQGSRINVIDTPGHVDFTIEVERSLRVLDGAVLLLCAVGGVQAQSITIDRQMRRYGIPRLAFINKMDRTGADPLGVVKQLQERLGCETLLLQLPIGAEADFQGVVDLVAEEAVYFDGPNGEKVRREAIPANMVDEAAAARRHMLEDLSMYSDELLEALLSEESVPQTLVRQVIRKATLAQQITPVLMGTAYRNKGVQPLLDAVVDYLPSPLDCPTTAHGADDPAEEIVLQADPNQPAVAMAFKIVEDPHGTLTFMRIYQGTLAKGQSYYNQRTGRQERLGRMVRMHADQREELSEASAGDIVAVMGLDTASGDTYCAQRNYALLQNMHVPEPVIQMAVAPMDREGAGRLAKALQRFRREDPTFRVTNDEETGETLIGGMGELHLQIYVQRIQREYRVDVEVGQPKVSYREAPTQPAKFEVRHRKQTGGSGQYAHIIGRFEPLPEDAEEPFLFEEHVTGGRIPKQYIPAVEKGFRSLLRKGPVAGFPVVGLAVHLDDGSFHEVDSSDLAFQTAAQIAMREFFSRTKPVLLEPVMKIEIECPSTFQGAVVGDLTGRRGMVMGAKITGPTVRVEGEVPLAETFGYSTSLRSLTQGQGTFTLEFARYNRLSPALERTIIEERRKKMATGAV
ncbi:MAG: elongation factor G [Pirellulales bacterium]|nr:elongation factor G [Pirellulales bacterium]